MAVQLLQAVPIRYPVVEEDGFLPNPERLEPLVGPRTKAMIVNSPSNPLGSVLDAGLAEALCRFADRHDVWLISDECYDAITFERPH